MAFSTTVASRPLTLTLETSPSCSFSLLSSVYLLRLPRTVIFFLSYYCLLSTSYGHLGNTRKWVFFYYSLRSTSYPHIGDITKWFFSTSVFSLPPTITTERSLFFSTTVSCLPPMITLKIRESGIFSTTVCGQPLTYSHRTHYQVVLFHYRLQSTSYHHIGDVTR